MERDTFTEVGEAMTAGPLAYRLLGPVEVVRDGQALSLGGAKPRSLLASLLLEANRLVSDERVIGDVWGEEVPSTVRAQLYTLVSGLRSKLGDSVIERRPQGYVINVLPEQLDLEVFDQAVVAAREASANGDLAHAAQRLRQACAIWTGPALGGVTEALSGRAGPYLQEKRLTALEDWMDAELALDNHAEVVGELWNMVGNFPLREKLRAQLMVALCRCGRIPEALEVYRTGRRLFVDELGIEPGAELQDLHQAILSGDPARTGSRLGDHPAGQAASVVAFPPVPPALLPPDVGDFIGRAAQVEELVAALNRDRTHGSPTAPLVAVVTGKPGVGKTALAVHVAQTVRDGFPDGQLYADLGGADSTPTDPAEVLARFLRSLGVDPLAVTGDLSERVDLYRTVLSRRRVLIVLDGAADAGQVAPLIPGGPGCAVLITSRGRVRPPGALPVDLAPMDHRTALELLTRIVGEARVGAEPQAADLLVELCGRLPLAIRVTAARLSAKPHWSLATLTARLSDGWRRLDELAHGHLEVRAALASAYRALDDRERLMFRRLALLETPSFAGWVGAALMNTSRREAEDLIERLVDAHLLDAARHDVTGQVYYSFHDLIRLFAREEAEGEPWEARLAALTRAFGAWLMLVQRAHNVVHGSEYAVVHGSAPRWPLDPAQVDEILADALAWYDAERLSLLAVVRQSAHIGLDEMCWDLSVTATVIFRTRHHYDEWRMTLDHALRVTRQTGNRRGEAVALTMLGGLHLARQQFAEALSALGPALAMLEQTEDRYGLALAELLMTLVDLAQGKNDATLRRCETLRAAFRDAGDSGLEAVTLTRIGYVHYRQGDVRRAQQYVREALALIQKAGGRDCLQTLHWIGDFFLDQGQLDTAEETFRQMIEMTGRVNDPRVEAAALLGLGTVRFRRGDQSEAARLLRDALSISPHAGERLLHARILLTLGELGRVERDHDTAGAHLAQAAEIYRQANNPLWLARTLCALGDLRRDIGDHDAAGVLWSEALRIFSGLGSPEAREIVARLDARDADPGRPVPAAARGELGPGWCQRSPVPDEPSGVDHA